MGTRVHTGLGRTCLFAGPPGTGKTMAAQVIAYELGLEIYRIDLSQVVDKYIGETEKNLARLFDEADTGSLVLFFDEADAMFGKRTAVKNSHDRYANRLRLWQRLLPAPEYLADDFDLELLANSFPLSGGEIKNSVLVAAFCAAHEDTTLSMRHLIVGTWRELQKNGRLIDPQNFGPWIEYLPARRPRR